jgi:hypothetical protein
MPSNSKRQKRFFLAVKHAKHNPGYGDPRLHKVADSMTDKDIDDFTKHVTEFKVKKAILSVIKDCMEITNLDELFNSGEKADSDETVITKEFTVEGKFEDYVKRFMGQRLSEKELEAVNTFQDKKPKKIESNSIRYEITDQFRNNTTIVVKKLHEGVDFIYVAFVKQIKPGSPEDKQQQSGGDTGGMGGMGGGMGSPPMMENLGASDQPTPSNDMSVPTNPDFAGGTAPYEESKDYFKKFLPKNESKAYVNWPDKLNEQGPTDPLGALGSQPPMAPPPGQIPGQGSTTMTAPSIASPKTPDQRKKEMGVDDITIKKSNTFKKDIDGGRILVEFLKNVVV